LVEVIRDVAIIILAFESIVIGVALLLTLLQLRSLTRLLRDEISPMLHAAEDTVNAVKGSVDFVSDTAVQPIIGAAGQWAAFKRGLQVLLRLRGRR